MPCARLVSAAALVACATIACRPNGETAPPPAGPVPVPWYSGDALQARPAADAPATATTASPAAAPSSAAKVARLDVLLDLLDAARFADDAAARDGLWQALGGNVSARGADATREAGSRILADALKLDTASDLDADAKGFLAGAISVLSADLGLVGAAEDLAIRTAVYRDIATEGHPRAADNARWRLYDHVRGCLVGAVSAPQDRRVEVALHSLYVREDSLAPWLDDRAVHAQAPLPAPDALIALMTGERATLGDDPRWRSVARSRAPQDATLEQTVRTTLPAVRDPAWALAVMPVGTARRDSLVPIVRIDDKDVTVDVGRPDARTGERGAPELVKALEGALARDGRGGVLLVAPPMLPSPAVNSIFRTLYDGRVARIELAVREPRVGEDAGDVVVQLPLEVLRDTDQGPAAVALRKARLHLHLGGRGVRLAVDGRWHDLRPGPSDLANLLISLDRAFPREHMVTVSLGDDLLYQQLLDDLRALIGGPQRHFEVAAWRPAAPPPPELAPKAVAAEEKRLQTRFNLYTETMFAALDPGALTLPENDNKRLEALARQLLRCLPELESPLKSGEQVRLDLRFDEGRLAQISATGKAAKTAKTGAAALQRCAEEESKGFRLRETTGAVTVGVLLSPS